MKKKCPAGMAAGPYQQVKLAASINGQLWCVNLLDRDKFVLANAAQWADPIFRQVFKCSTLGDAVFRITGFWVVFVAAQFTGIFLHVNSPFQLVFNDR